MPKIEYVSKKFSAKSQIIIDQANEIIEEYQDDGLDLTLRQLYYQFVSRDIIPNKQSEYKRLGNILSDARLAGEIDWEAMVDRTRNLKDNNHWNDPGEIIRASARQFKLDHWAGQEFHVEVWIEKEALVGVISGICKKLDVPYFACKGYVSQSEMWSAGQRLHDYAEEGQTPVIIHLGDHDPSGIDMTRDITDRQDLFTGAHQVVRIALNMDQVDEYNPPPNPAKLTDSRCAGYISEFGSSSWELDALEPRMLQRLIKDEVESFRDNSIYHDVLRQENKFKEILQRVEQNWETL